MLLHNSYIKMAITNILMYCKGLQNVQISRNAKSIYQKMRKGGEFPPVLDLGASIHSFIYALSLHKRHKTIVTENLIGKKTH